LGRKVLLSERLEVVDEPRRILMRRMPTMTPRSRRMGTPTPMPTPRAILTVVDSSSSDGALAEDEEDGSEGDDEVGRGGAGPELPSVDDGDFLLVET